MGVWRRFCNTGIADVYIMVSQKIEREFALLGFASLQHLIPGMD